MTRQQSLSVPKSCPEAEGDPMPDLPFFQVVKDLIETQPIEFDKKTDQKKRWSFRIARPRHDSSFKVLLRFCRRKSMMSKSDDINEMPQRGLRIYINHKPAYMSFSMDLTKKCLTEPIDVTSLCTGGDTLNELVLWVYCSEYLKGFCFAVKLVEELTPEQLCKNMVKNQLQPAEETRTAVRAQLSGDGDSETAATSVHASLCCPIAKTRLRYPCRSKFCSHIQCLDALTMVSMNAKKTTWSCMVCSVSCLYGDLVIDSLFLEILNTVPETVTDVEFRKDGSWTYKGNKADTPRPDAEMSIIELDLSKTSEIKDLTETDDEHLLNPKPKKEATITPQYKITSQSRVAMLGDNYEHSSTPKCHRNNRHHQKYSRNRTNKPYQRNNRPHERYNHGGYNNRVDMSRHIPCLHEQYNHSWYNNIRDDVSRHIPCQHERYNHSGYNNNTRDDVSRHIPCQRERYNHGGYNNNNRDGVSRNIPCQHERYNHSGYNNNTKEDVSRQITCQHERYNHGGYNNNNRDGVSRHIPCQHERYNHGGYNNNTRDNVSRHIPCQHEQYNHTGYNNNTRDDVSRHIPCQHERYSHSGYNNNRDDVSRHIPCQHERYTHGGYNNTRRDVTRHIPCLFSLQF